MYFMEFLIFVPLYVYHRNKKYMIYQSGFVVVCVLHFFCLIRGIFYPGIYFSYSNSSYGILISPLSFLSYVVLYDLIIIYLLNIRVFLIIFEKTNQKDWQWYIKFERIYLNTYQYKLYCYELCLHQNNKPFLEILLFVLFFLTIFF